MPLDQQCQADQPTDAREDDPDHAVSAVQFDRGRCARGRVRGRTLLAAVRHQAKRMWREPRRQDAKTPRLTVSMQKERCCFIQGGGDRRAAPCALSVPRPPRKSSASPDARRVRQLEAQALASAGGAASPRFGEPAAGQEGPTLGL